MKLIPRVSEKAVNQSGSGFYVFVVPSNATKPDVKKAVSDAFKVKVEGVNLLMSKGKAKTFRRIPGQESDYKKAYVKLAKGQKISLFEESK